jgi:hypothetical protein
MKAYQARDPDLFCGVCPISHMFDHCVSSSVRWASANRLPQ